MKPKLMQLIALITCVLPIAAGAATAIHNVQGHASTDDGIGEFSVQVFDEAGRIPATGDKPLLRQYSTARWAAAAQR